MFHSRYQPLLMIEKILSGFSWNIIVYFDVLFGLRIVLPERLKLTPVAPSAQPSSERSGSGAGPWCTTTYVVNVFNNINYGINMLETVLFIY